MKKLILLLYMISIITLNIIPAETSRYSKYTDAAAARMKELESKLIAAQKKRPFLKKTSPTFASNFKFTYDPTSKIFSLISPIQKKIHDVISYQLSPRKKYFIIQQETIEGALTQLLGESLGKLKKKTRLLRINTRTGESIAFPYIGKLLTYALDPSEDLFLTAWIKESLMGKKPSNVHASTIPGFRKRSPIGAILQYGIFDLTSQQKNTPIKTIENVQAIQFNKSHELLVKYDDDIVEKIKFRQTQSFLNKIINATMPSYFTKKWDIDISTPTKTEQKDLIGTMYDEAYKTFKLTIPKLHKKEEFESINSYYLSPQKNFIIINSPVKGITAIKKGVTGDSADIDTTFVNLQQDTKNNTFGNVISYDLNYDETKLIIFCPQVGLFTTDSKPTYQLFDISSQKVVKVFSNIRFAYFDKADRFQAEKLIIVSEQGKIIECDPNSGIPYAKIEKLQEEESTKFKKELAKEELEEEETEGHIPATTQSDLLSSITQTAYSFVENIRKYFNPTPIKEQKKQQTSTISIPQTLSKEEKEEENDEDILEQYEDIRFLMENFINNKNMEHMDKIISELYLDESSDRDYFINTFKQYDVATKKDFASLFFAKPAGDLNITGMSASSCESKNFDATITNDTIWIKKKNAEKAISIKDDLDYETNSLLFDNAEKYLAVAYDINNKAIIDIFVRKNDTFSFSSTITPADFNTIIGLRFVNTRDNKTYLFFIDKNYKLGLYDLQNKILLTSKQQESPSKPIMTVQPTPPISPGIPVEPIATSAVSILGQPIQTTSEESLLEKETINFCNQLLKMADELGIDQSRRERLESILTKELPLLIEREFLELAKDILYAKVSTYENLMKKIEDSYSPETIEKYNAIISKVKSGEIPSLKAANTTLKALSNLESLAQRVEQKEKAEKEEKS